nr:hypothetical protein [uncultured archaeon]
MEIKLSYEEVKTNHSDLIGVLVGKMQTSKLKDKSKSEREYDFYYSYGVAVRGMNFGEMVNQIHNRDFKTEQEKSSSEIINEKLNSVIGLSLTISSGRTKRYIALSEKPRLFVDKFSEIYIESIKEIKKEEERLSKLTPDEKDREIQESINELSEMGGFLALNVGNNGVKQILPQEIDYDVDDILDKIGRVGVDGLTEGERKFLKQHSK